VTIVAVSDPKRSLMLDVDRYNASSKAFLERVREIHLTGNRVPMALQDVAARWLLHRIVGEVGEPDSVLDYNTVFLGRALQSVLRRENLADPIPRAYDLADYLPQMVGPALGPFVPFAPLATATSDLVLRWSLRSASVVSTPFPSLATKFGVEPARVLHVPNGVDLTLFSRKPRDSARGRYAMGDERPIIGYVGSLREWVDFEPVLQALRSVKAELGSCPRLVVAGREGGFDDLVTRANSLGLKGDLTMLGTILFEDVPWFLSACDATVVPFRKGLVGDHAVPLKILEALACETLVACPRLPAISATFGSHVVACDKVQEYASLFRALSENPGQFQSMRSAGRDFVAANFSWPKALRPLIDFLEGRGSS
jgi:glycosyltransferase involved in cell wall biosynthesis